ncbi:MAG: hypothetical protein H6767_06675 [Candidatus Peribacteria bacterium]|nr:MAG: hypothetical protein H6767_06675 [Candidatus Peribacteria bacterium]
MVEDSTNALRDSVYSIINTVSESGKVLVENTINLTRHPINTIFSVENWKKLFKTPFIVGADVLMKAKALPFATMDKAMQYIINNNLERIVFGLQAGTSQALANWITSNGETGSKTLKVVGSIAEDIGDLAGDIVKVVPGIAGLGLNKLNKYVGNL